MDKGTGSLLPKFVGFPCGRSAEGYKDTLMVQTGMSSVEAGNFLDALNSTSALKCAGFNLGTQYEGFTLPSAPTTVKQKINFLFTIKGEKRKKIYVNIPLHFDGTFIDDINAVKTALMSLTGLGIGEISDVSYKQMGSVRV